MDLWRFKREHDHYAAQHIEMFLVSLGEFFYKYIHRSLNRIEAEQRFLDSQQQMLTASNDVGLGSQSPAEAFRARLVQMRRQMYCNGSSSSSSSCTGSNSSKSSSSENLRADSLQNSAATVVAAGLASANLSPSRSSSKKLPQNTSALIAEKQKSSTAMSSSILGLKERLAKLKEGTTAIQPPAPADPSQLV